MSHLIKIYAVQQIQLFSSLVLEELNSVALNCLLWKEKTYRIVVCWPLTLAN